MEKDDSLNLNDDKGFQNFFSSDDAGDKEENQPVENEAKPEKPREEETPPEEQTDVTPDENEGYFELSDVEETPPVEPLESFFKDEPAEKPEQPKEEKKENIRESKSAPVKQAQPPQEPSEPETPNKIHTQQYYEKPDEKEKEIQKPYTAAVKPLSHEAEIPSGNKAVTPPPLPAMPGKTGSFGKKLAIIAGLLLILAFVIPFGVNTTDETTTIMWTWNTFSIDTVDAFMQSVFLCYLAVAGVALLLTPMLFKRLWRGIMIFTIGILGGIFGFTWFLLNLSKFAGMYALNLPGGSPFVFTVLTLSTYIGFFLCINANAVRKRFEDTIDARLTNLFGGLLILIPSLLLITNIIIVAAGPSIFIGLKDTDAFMPVLFFILSCVIGAGILFVGLVSLANAGKNAKRSAGMFLTRLIVLIVLILLPANELIQSLYKMAKYEITGWNYFLGIVQTLNGYMIAYVMLMLVAGGLRDMMYNRRT